MSLGTRRSPRAGRRQQRRPIVSAVAGLIVIVAIAAFVWIAENSYNGLPFISYRTVYASVPNIGHLQLHDQVEISGVRVGQVLATSARGGHALVELQLQGVGPLPSDTRVIVRAEGLLGTRYVQIVPGTSRTMLPDGATITENGPQTYYQGVPETLDLLNARTRGALGETLRGLGEGLLGRGRQLGGAIQSGPPSGVNFDLVANSILGRPGAAARLLPATNSGVQALDAARNDLAGLLGPAATTMQALIDKRTRFDQALAVAPSTLSAVDAGLGAPAQRLLAALRSFGGAAGSVLPDAPGALRATAMLLAAAPQPLGKTRLALDAVPSAVPAALHILGSLAPDLTPLRNGFNWASGPVANLSAHGCDVYTWGEAWKSVLGQGTAPGGGLGLLTGFRVGVLTQGTQALGDYIPTGAYPDENPYKTPCQYEPGKTYTLPSLSTILGGAVP
jgi:phospholipid/cholesterol/gamma-HCH transport system substrate-binding protein